MLVRPNALALRVSTWLCLRPPRCVWQAMTGQGSVDAGAIKSRFYDPRYGPNNYWMPKSVPAVKAQPWQNNYLDGNIADNPVMRTVPDKLIGLMHVSQLRRTKYIAVSKLTDDYLGLYKERTRSLFILSFAPAFVSTTSACAHVATLCVTT